MGIKSNKITNGQNAKVEEFAVSRRRQSLAPIRYDRPAIREQKKPLGMVGTFMEFDSNRDGKLSKTEAKQLPPIAAKFDEADKNKDGLLTREELTTIVKKDIANMRRGLTGPGAPDGMDRRVARPMGRGAGGTAGMRELGPPILGQVLPEPAQDRLKLTAAQKK